MLAAGKPSRRPNTPRASILTRPSLWLAAASSAKGT